MAAPVIRLLDCVEYFGEVLRENREIESKKWKTHANNNLLDHLGPSAGADECAHPIDVEVRIPGSPDPQLPAPSHPPNSSLVTDPGQHYTVKEEPQYMSDHFYQTPHSSHYTTAHLLPYAADPQMKDEPLHFFMSSDVPTQLTANYYTQSRSSQHFDSQSVVSAESFAEEPTEELFPDCNDEMFDVVGDKALSPPRRPVPVSHNAAHVSSPPRPVAGLDDGRAAPAETLVAKSNARRRGRPPKKKGNGNGKENLVTSKNSLSILKTRSRLQSKRGTINAAKEASKKKKSYDQKMPPRSTRARTSVATTVKLKEMSATASRTLRKPTNARNISGTDFLKNKKKDKKLKASAARTPAPAQNASKNNKRTKGYSCHICGNSYDYQSSLTRHIGDAHKNHKKRKTDRKNNTAGVGVTARSTLPPANLGSINRAGKPESADTEPNSKLPPPCGSKPDSASSLVTVVGSESSPTLSAKVMPKSVENYNDNECSDMDYSDKDDNWLGDNTGWSGDETEWSGEENHSKNKTRSKKKSTASRNKDSSSHKSALGSENSSDAVDRVTRTSRIKSKVSVTVASPAHARKTKKKKAHQRYFSYYCNQCAKGFEYWSELKQHQCAPSSVKSSTPDIYSTLYFSELSQVFTCHQCSACGVWTLKGQQTRDHCTTCQVTSPLKAIASVDVSKEGNGKRTAARPTTGIISKPANKTSVQTCPICKLYSSPTRNMLGLHISVNHEEVNDAGETKCPFCRKKSKISLFFHLLNQCKIFEKTRHSMPRLPAKEERFSQYNSLTCTWCQLAFCDVTSRLLHQTTLTCDVPTLPLSGEQSSSNEEQPESAPLRGEAEPLLSQATKRPIPKSEPAVITSKIYKAHPLLEGLFMCRYCTVTSRYKTQLTFHYERVHSETRPTCGRCYTKVPFVHYDSHVCKVLVCPICKEYSTPSKYQLGVHLTMVHLNSGGIELTECALCAHPLNRDTIFHHLLTSCAKLCGEEAAVAKDTAGSNLKDTAGSNLKDTAGSNLKDTAGSNLKDTARCDLLDKEETQGLHDVMSSIEKLLLEVEVKVVPVKRPDTSDISGYLLENTEASYWCSSCGKPCCSSALLKKHKESAGCKEISAALRQIESENAVKCDTCNQVFIHAQLLEQHLLDVGQVWKCVKCNLWFEESERDDHIECQGAGDVELADVNAEGACSICKRFSSKDPNQMAHHIAQVHNTTETMGILSTPWPTESQESNPLLPKMEQPTATGGHPTAIDGPSTSTDAPPTSTDAPPTSTDAPPTSTDAPPTATDAPPTCTDAPPTLTGGPPTATDAPPTATDDSPAVLDRPPRATKSRRSAATARAKIVADMQLSDYGSNCDDDTCSMYSAEGSDAERSVNSSPLSPADSSVPWFPVSPPALSLPVKSPLKNTPLNCPTCGKHFIKYPLLTDHVQGEHVYKCVRCDNWQLGYSAYEMHKWTCKAGEQAVADNKEQVTTIQPQGEMSAKIPGEVQGHPSMVQGSNTAAHDKMVNGSATVDGSLAWSTVSQSAETSQEFDLLASLFSPSESAPNRSDVPPQSTITPSAPPPGSTTTPSAPPPGSTTTPSTPPPGSTTTPSAPPHESTTTPSAPPPGSTTTPSAPPPGSTTTPSAPPPGSTTTPSTPPPGSTTTPSAPPPGSTTTPSAPQPGSTTTPSTAASIPNNGASEECTANERSELEKKDMPLEELVNQIAEAKVFRKTCPICMLKLNNWQALYAHISERHYLACDKCDKPFNKAISQLASHLSSCKQKPFSQSFKCPICKVYTIKVTRNRTMNRVVRHLELNHMQTDEDGKQRCPVCQRALTGGMTLITHLYMESCDTPPESSSALSSASQQQPPDADPIHSSREKAWFSHDQQKKTTQVMPPAVKTMYVEKAGYILPPRACHICKQGVFKFISAYQSHILKEHHLELPGKGNYCTACLKVMEMGETLREHQKSNTCIKTFYPCDLCELICGTELEFRIHKNQKHLTAADQLPCFVCVVCGLYLHTQEALNAHKVSHTTKSATALKLKCIVCDADFANRIVRSRHEKEVHFQELKCQYDNCGWRSKRKDAARRWSTFRMDYRDHLQAEHGLFIEGFSCKFCSLSHFKTRKERNEHMKKMHESRPMKCPDCQYVSVSGPAMAAHKAAYHSNKLLQCQLCPFSCRWFTSMTRHTATIHSSNRKQFQCEFCDRKFTQSGSVNRHMKTAHPEEC